MLWHECGPSEMPPITRLPRERLAAPRLQERTSKFKHGPGKYFERVAVTTQRITPLISIFWMPWGSGKSAAALRAPGDPGSTPPSGALTDSQWLPSSCLCAGGDGGRSPGLDKMAKAKNIGWAIYAAGFAIWLFGYLSAGHTPLFDWNAATPWWISSFIPNLEAELGLALMFASMIPIYGRAVRG